LRFLISTLHYQNNWRSLEKNSKFQFKPNIEELALVIRRVKNRESYLPYPITGNWADKLIQLESKFKSEDDDVESLFESLENKLKRKLLPSWLQINPNSLDYLDPLAQLMATQSLEYPVECFSLNYDETLENFLKHKHEVQPYCGFVSGEWKGPKTKDIEGFDRLNLYKLHGSLNWVRLMDSGTIKMRENLQEEEKKDIDPRHDPYLIFGHGLKTFSLEPFSSLMYHFKESLSSRPYIFAIGYSFFDPYINNLIIEALNKNESSKLIIVNPTFGPEDLKGDESRILSEYIEEIQNNAFYSEMPEFNMHKIRGTNRIRYIKVGFDTFLSENFIENGKGLINLINEFEIDRKKEENPF
ncbi:MAG: SIR2 family protein, partial [Bacteroidota bacterium]